MDALIKQQMGQKLVIGNALRNYKKDSNDRKTAVYYERRLKNLIEDWQAFKTRHYQILACGGVEKEEELEYFKNDVYSETEDAFMNAYTVFETDYAAKYRKSQEETNSEGNQTPQKKEAVHHHEEGIKLPRIQLPKFNGDYKIWPSFHDLFKTLVHDNKSLSSVEKLQYLKLHLAGEPDNLLKHFLITDRNYATAWDLLNERYNDKRILVQSQLQCLLAQGNIFSESSHAIKNLLDNTTECLQALQNLEVDTSTWDPLIVYITVQKLPNETHQLWEQTISQSKDMPSWKTLKEFLEARFRALEAVSTKWTRPAVHNKNMKCSFKAQSYHTFSKPICPLCAQNHKIRQCSEFLQMDHDDRISLVKAKGLCNNCLGYGHLQGACPSKFKCVICSLKHHTLLHKNSLSNNNGMKHQPQQAKSLHINFASLNLPTFGLNERKSNPGTKVETFNNHLIQDIPIRKHILLATAIVTACGPNGHMQKLRALIDQGSQASFITEDAAQLLHLKRENVLVTIAGIGQHKAGKINNRAQFTLLSAKDRDFSLIIKSFVMKNLTNILPSRLVRQENWNHLDDLELADPYYFQPGRIDLLLGADVYADIILEGLRKGQHGAPIAQRTVFGWILSGEVDQLEKKSLHINSFYTTMDLDRELRRFWELEEVPQRKPLTEEEKTCEEFFQNTTRRLTDGRYEVQLPFADKTNLSFGKSRDAAVARLLQMERRFQTDPSLKEDYVKCITEYEELGHMKPARTKEEEHILGEVNNVPLFSCCYLPHHFVLKLSSSTTKLRVVFHASMKTRNGISLNDTLLTGPTVQPDLFILLLRWRRYKIALMADVEKMYRQIQVADCDSNFQRIVWRKSANEPIRDYVLTTVTFGTRSAPFLATRTMTQLALDEQDRFPIGAEVMLNEMYVDDILSGADCENEAIRKQEEIIELMQSGRFNVRKWASNSMAVLQNVPEESREMKLPLDISSKEIVKALGLSWNPVNDYFSYMVTLQNPPNDITKRTILSDVAKLFDPLGWLAPITIKAKIMIQKLWLQGLQWDEPAPEHIKSEWLQYRQKLDEIEIIKVPRWIQFSNKTRAVEFHGFCDASNLAYAAVIQICIVTETNKRATSLLAAKSKVAPVKTISTPRLELCGALLLARLLNQVKNAMNIPTSLPVTIFAWTDSQIVLTWLKGHPSRWKSFVANRVTKIHELVGEIVWRYIPSKENPADCASRGISPSELKENTLWWSGPNWLTMEAIHWPMQPPSPQTEPEVAVLHMKTIEPWEVLEKYSSLQSLCRVIAYCLRFHRNLQLKNKAQKCTGPLTASEIKKALTSIIRSVQREYFPEEFKSIEASVPLKVSSPLIKLDPFLHSDGLLRVGGRLRNADIDFEEKHPIIIPAKCHVTVLLIRKHHAMTLHGGVQLTMRSLRQLYWIINCRDTVRRHLHRCVICHKHRLQFRTQLMADLPSARVRASRPFTHTGVDYCGPFDIKSSKGRGIRSYKAWVSIFICFSTRAIHLELVSDLSTPGFLAALRRFVARRGLPAHMYSDRGTNFVGANTVLKNQKKELIEANIADKLANDGIQWHFNPPAAPHFGGLWEAGVKSTKYHMKRIMGSTILTYEEFSTILTQIECCLNSRPISELSNDPNDLSPLTPGHFLIGGHLQTVQEPSILEENPNHLNRWRLLQHMYQSFWKRWSTDYLSNLQQRPKWTKRIQNISIGELVLIRDENLPPCRWLLGRVTEVNTGSDGLVRVAKVKTQHSVLTRSITKLSPLPIEYTIP